MAKNFEHIIHKHSDVVTNGQPKLPTSSQIEYGELAINYAKGNETIAMKNSNNEIVTFGSNFVSQEDFEEVEFVVASTFSYIQGEIEDIGERIESIEDDIDEKIEDLTNEIIDDEKVISSAFNDINERVSTLSSNFEEGIETIQNEIDNDGKVISSALNNLDARVSAVEGINGLPTVTSSDNGKTLMVVNGVWTLVNPTTIYSGSGLPDSSQGNNGDIYLQTS